MGRIPLISAYTTSTTTMNNYEYINLIHNIIYSMYCCRNTTTLCVNFNYYPPDSSIINLKRVFVRRPIRTKHSFANHVAWVEPHRACFSTPHTHSSCRFGAEERTKHQLSFTRLDSTPLSRRARALHNWSRIRIIRIVAAAGHSRNADAQRGSAKTIPPPAAQRQTSSSTHLNLQSKLKKN